MKKDNFKKRIHLLVIEMQHNGVGPDKISEIVGQIEQ